MAQGRRYSPDFPIDCKGGHQVWQMGINCA
jgi:hypothetical protein